MAARKDCYTDEEKAEIMAHVLVNVACGRFVSRIFREDATTEGGIKLPAPTTFWKWVLEDTSGELEQKVADARAKGIEAILDETLDIADEVQHDTIRDDNGTARPNSEWITRSRLRVDTRIKLAQMMKPKTYGDKLDLTSGGKPLRELNETERAMRIAAVLNRHGQHDADAE